MSTLVSARTSAYQARAMAEEVGAPQLVAEAALASGRVHAAEGDGAMAGNDFEAGLHAITKTDNLLIRAALQIDRSFAAP